MMQNSERKHLLQQLQVLEQQKNGTTDFMEQMEIAGEIHAIEMKLNNIKPTDSSMECEGCGS
tara:strand:- start:110 stop:295 length:186 start_codon:yes stop_codon:yes gene_type:complete